MPQADEKVTAVDRHGQSPSMALKPNVRPAPRAIMSPAVVAALFRDTRNASSLARRSSSRTASAIGLSMPRNTSMAWLRSKTIESSTPAEIVMHYLREAALGEQLAHAFEIVGHVGEAQTAPPEGGKLRSCLLRFRAQGLRYLLIAHYLDAGGESFEQLERHLFRIVIGGVGGARIEIGLGVGRAVLPAIGDVLGHAGEIAGDRLCKAAAERGPSTALCQRAGAVAIKEIFQRRQALERHALADKRSGVGCREVLLGERLVQLARAETLRVRPIEDALVAMLLGDRPEAYWLGHAPGFDRGGERFLRILEGCFRRRPAQRRHRSAQGFGAFGEMRVARPDELLERGSGDGRVICLGLRRRRAEK